MSIPRQLFLFYTPITFVPTIIFDRKLTMFVSRCFIHAPAFIFLFIAILAKATLAAEMPLGDIVMQLRSSVDAENTDELNETLEAVTTNYLNEYFNAYYARTEQPKNYFSDAKLSTTSFGVYGVEGSFITTIEIEGTLSFNSDTLPTSEFIDTLLRNGFQGRNEQLYLDQLLNADDDFLQNLRYLIIDINKIDSEEPPKLDDGSSATQNSSEKNILDQERPLNIMERTRSEKMILAFICVTCVVLFFLLLFCGWLLYKRSQKRKNQSKENSGEGEEPLKVIKLPVKQQSSSSKKKNIDHKMISPTATETTARLSPQSIGFPDRPPSPQRSMTSQESSHFTYTDNMSRWTTKNTTNQNRLKSAGSPFSKWSLDDLSSWRGGRQDPPAFRSDVSAIPKKNDLNLSPEARDIEKGYRNNKDNRVTRHNSNNRKPSRKSRVALDERQSKSRYSNRSETYFYNGQYDHNESDTGGEYTADDVICDLRDLSMQIREQRRNTKSKRVYNQ